MNKKISLQELAELTGALLHGDPHLCISGADALDAASPEDASFLANPRYRYLLKQTQAGVICIDRSTPLEEGKNFLICDDPSTAFQMIIKELFSDSYASGFLGVHPTAVIHPTATLGQDVCIGPYAVICQNARIGDQTQIDAFVHVGAGTEIGKESHLYPHVVIREQCQIGNRVILQPGAVIGSCGFGYITSSQGEHTKLEQLGTVIIEDDVEIGANTTIDRARFKETRISKGTKIDNLVQIGHNVHIGVHNIIVSQTGIAGSVKTGRNVVFGGQAGVVGHIEIADHVMIATRGGISKSLRQSGKYGGSPVMNLSEYNRQQVYLRQIEKYVDQIAALEKRLEMLESRLSETV